MPRLLSEELERNLRSRLASIERQVAELRSRLGGGSRRLAVALDLIGAYPPYLAAVLDAEWRVTTAEIDRVGSLRGFLAHAVDVEGLLESWLIHSFEAPAPIALTRAVERECHELGQDRVALLAVGPADNYVTYVDELAAKVFNASPRVDPPTAVAGLPRFALMQLPRLQMDDALLWPVVVGHETAHLGLLTRPLAQCVPAFAALDWADLIARLPDTPAAADERKAWALAAEEQATYWAEELLCDAYAVRRFGPAAVAALGSVLDALGAIDQASDTHPDAALRLRLMLSWLGPVTTPRLRALIEPWEQATSTGATRYRVEPDRLIARQLGEELRDAFPQGLAGWPAAFDVRLRLPAVEQGVAALRAGRPPLRHPVPDPVPADADAEVVSAGWVGIMETDVDDPSAERDRQVIGRLVAKALDTHEFLRQWRSAQDRVADERCRREASSDTAAGAGRDPVHTARSATRPGARPGARRWLRRHPGAPGALTATQLHRRLQTGDERGLYVAPLLPPALSGSGVDLRLGSQFIVFQRIGTWAIDPVYGRADPRSMQCLVEKAWGEQFVLHPGELVLASTLEYLVMPADLAGQVVTRSSYGRLGLTTASAVLVQPGFRGCLTLGLVNLGGVPIQLTPGERIAQLIVHTAMPRQAETSEKYDCPTGPEFSRVSMDPDAVVLQEMRRTAELAGARAPAGPWWR